MTIDELVEQSWHTAIEKGWWAKERSMGDLIALFHSEISEAFEEMRSGHPLDQIYHVMDGNGNQKPEGVPIELADVLIRIADFCGQHMIDLDSAVRQKLEYNKTRTYRHGGKIL